ncbi:MAG: FlgD immunoglobulin-like domain containing protein [Candidatus Eisenbacteria bacterium]
MPALCPCRTSWLLGLGALLAAPAPTAAQCSYPVIPPGVQVSFPSGTIHTPKIVVPRPAWVAVALRHTPPADWDLGVYGGKSDPPQCVGEGSAVSSRPGSLVEFLACNFHLTEPGPVQLGAYPIPLTPSGGATLEWDDGGDVIALNSGPIERSMAADDLVECFEIYVQAGQTYQVRFTVMSGGSGFGLSLFESAGPTWLKAVSGNTLAQGHSTVTPLYTGWMALVLTNPYGQPGRYSFAVVTCLPPTELVPNVSVERTGLQFHFSLDQQRTSFMALGARGDEPIRWSVRALAGPANGLPQDCYGGLLARSETGDRPVEYVVGDFRPGEMWPGFVFAASSAMQARTSAMRMEWDDGAGWLTVNDPPVHGTTGAADVLRLWNVTLQAGVPYTVHFEHVGDADLDLAIFGRAAGGSWLAREQRAARGTGTFAFTPAVGGDYALVLVNDNGGSGSYDVAIFAPGTGVGVGDGPAPVTALEGIAPNPMSAGCLIRFALARPGTARFEVVDPSGRRRATIEAGTREAGQGTTEWDGRGTDGQRLPAGVYFIRMSAEGRRIESARVVVLTR